MDRSHWRFRKIRATHRANAAAANQPCAICGEKIDYSLQYPHQRAYTVEHIKALEHGGSLTDWNNLAPAHWVCNVGQGTAIAQSKLTTSRQWV